MNHHKQYDKIFQNFYNTYKNQIFYDIVKEFHARITGNMKKYKKNKKAGIKCSPFVMKTKSISHMNSGGITINSNCVKYNAKRKTIFLSIFNKEYFKNNFDGKNSAVNRYKIYCIFPDDFDIKNVHLSWKSDKIYANIIYERKRKNIINMEENPYILSMDPGQENIYTLFSNNPQAPSILLRNNSISHINGIYKNNVSKLTASLPTNKKGNPYSKNQQKISNCINSFERKRNMTLRNESYKFTNRIIDYCRKYKIGTIVIGHNSYQKTNMNMGKKNNRSYYSLPHYKFNYTLKYKCNEIGINFIYQEESYTSRLDALNPNVDIWKYEYGTDHLPPKSILKLGERESRSIYNSFSHGYKINADINGAINIMQKYTKNHIDKINNYGSIFHPITIHNDAEFLKLFQ